MLQDRVYAISETIFHDPYYQRHVIGAPRILSADGERIESEASYAVFRTKHSQPPTVFTVGRYPDAIQHPTPGLEVASRHSKSEQGRVRTARDRTGRYRW